MRDSLVVHVGPDQVDERRRDERLLDDVVDQVAERGIGRGDRGLEQVEVLVEHRHGQRDPVGEMPVEAALADAGLLRHGVERRLQSFGREHLARRRDEGAPVLGAGARPTVDLASP